MVSELSRSKNFSKMKSPKSNSRSRRNKLSLVKDPTAKTPRKETSLQKVDSESKDKSVKSGSWKRTPHKLSSSCSLRLSTNKFEATSITPSANYQPGLLYSDVLFNGGKLNTPVKVKSITPRLVIKTSSRSRKQVLRKSTLNINHKDSIDKNPCSFQLETSKSNSYGPKNSDDLEKCKKHLFRLFNIEIPAWNFSELGPIENTSNYVDQFNDINYLTCEKVAFVGLRLASDGKFGS